MSSSLREALKMALLPPGGSIAPGAVCRVEDRDGTLDEACSGVLGEEPWALPVEQGTTYDLASLTKLFVASTVARCVQAGELVLDGELRALLTHRSGLPAWRPYYQRGLDAGLSLGTGEARRWILDRACSEARESEGLHRYSDVGYLQLQEKLEQATGLPLERLVQREVLGPLELEDSIGWRSVFPVGGPVATPLGIAPTETCPWRERTICGEVHDDNAWAMGGVGGHAGLFGRADGVAGLGLAWLGSLGGEGDWLDPVLAQEWVSASEPGTHALGWDSASPGRSAAGSTAPSGVFGHLGFTGTSLWCDPRGRVVVLLCNRVHPHREDPRRGKEATRAFRAAVHDVAWTLGTHQTQMQPKS